MATRFKVQELQLTKQLVTASGDNLLYVNGNPVVAGVSGALNQTGLYLVSQITATGSQAWNAANNNGINLSGDLTLTGQTLRALTLGGDTNLSGQLTVTGQTLYQIVTGLSGQAVTDYATKTQLNTLSGFTTGLSGYLQSQINEANADVSSINGQSGVLTLAGTGGLTVISGGVGLILISGDNSISGALTQTGVALGAKIDSLSGYVGNVSGGLEARIAATGNAAVVHANGIGTNLSGNLTATGQTLYQMMTGLSGQADINYATVANLALTGSNLYATLTGLSGQAVIDYATKTSLTLTGQTLLNTIIGGDTNLSGNLTQTGVALLSIIAQTGQGSILYTNGASGALQSYINSVSGFVGNVSGGLEARITQTGVAAINHANSIGQTISGNLTQTGSTLDNKINSLSGFVGNVSGGLEARIAQTGSAAVVHANGIGIIISGNVTQTGVTLLGFIIGGDTNLSGNLTQTGSTLNTRINSLSGWADQIFVHRTGQELISGRKIFTSSPVLTGIEFAGASGSGVYASVQTDGVVSFAGPSGGLLSIDSGVNGSVFAVTNQYEAPYLDIYEDGRIYVGGFLSNALFISGSGAAFGVNYVPSGYNLFVSGNTQYIGNIYSGTTGGQVINIADLFYPRLTNPSGYVTGATLIATGSSLYVMLTGMSGAFNTTIQSTGQQAWSAAQNNALNLSGNLTQTGVTLRALTLGGDTNLSGNLTLTGQTLQTRIDSLSGYAAPRADYFYRTGVQTVSGNTTIQGNLTIISGQYEPQKTVSANYSVLSTDSRIYCNNGNPITLTLPSLASVSGQIVNVKLINTGSVILTGTAGQLFDGSPSYVIVGQYQSRQIHGGDATNWYLW